MQKYQAVVTGAPLTTTQFAQPAPPGPSLGQTLIGGLGTAAGLYGAFTGNNPLAAVGLAKGQTGGGIAGLVRAQNGTEKGLGYYLKNVPFLEDVTGVTKGLYEGVKPIGRAAARTVDDIYRAGTAPIEYFSTIKYPKSITGIDRVDEVEDPNIIVSVGPDGTVIRENIKTGEVQVQESEQAKQTKGGDVGGPVQNYPRLPEQGISSLESKEPKDKSEPKADQSPPPTAYQLREQDIANKEKGILDLLKGRKVTLETEATDAADASFRRQSANIAKAFAEFATKGGEGNILQKAIGTAGDNVDRFMASSDKYRKDIKDINKAIRKGDMDVAQFEYQQVKDKAARDDSKEAKDYARKTAAASAAYQKSRDRIADEFKSKEFLLKRDEINQKIRKDQEVNPSDILSIRDVVASELGYGKDTGGGIVGTNGASLEQKDLDKIKNVTQGTVDLIKESQRIGEPIDFDVASRIQAKATANNLSSNAVQLLINNKVAITRLKNNKGTPKQFAEQFKITEEEAIILRDRM